MTVAKYTSDELVTSARSRAGIGNTEVLGGDDSTILRYLNEEMYGRLIPGLMKIKEEYFVAVTRTTLTSETAYRIPTRALGVKLRRLVHVDSDGNRTTLHRLPPEDLPLFNNPLSGVPTHYYIEGNYVVLICSSASGYLEMSFYMRPGQLVLVSETRVISEVDTTNRQVTCTANVPSGWTNGTLFDIHSPDSGAEVKQWDLTGEIAGLNQVQFAEEIDGTVTGTRTPAVGDYLVLAGEAAVPGIPRELHPVLAQAAALRIAESLGDAQAVQLAKATLGELLSSGVYLVEDRVEGAPNRLVNRNSIWYAGRTVPTGSWSNG